MQQMAPILFPCIALVALTALVWLRMFHQRIGEMVTRRISAQSLSDSTKARERLQSITAADNFRNLFETPVLFYLLCICLAMTGLVAAPVPGRRLGLCGVTRAAQFHPRQLQPGHASLHHLCLELRAAVKLWAVFAFKLMSGA